MYVYNDDAMFKAWLPLPIQSDLLYLTSMRKRPVFLPSFGNESHVKIEMILCVTNIPSVKQCVMERK